ncbi:hypothetical protein INH39_18040 [Massilia violaceinigra]|uniref:CdiI immunity protein domain-containing protein n=1 Tax=Massilia violaceinigra TaxID=2045208 RepID=A0ABY3ZYJ4_9BURK|nr:hypothetical protein [Massilia violaceinigra]UOD27432.1 hypothetical protein INH39_18040 [Massilia violaceinigra]
MNDAYRRICGQLGLPLPGPFSQDWECELPGKFRTLDWLEKYLAYHAAPGCSSDEREIMMELMLETANDLANQTGQDVHVDKVIDALARNHRIHWEMIDYWALEDSTLEDAFALTPAIRLLKAALLRPSSRRRKSAQHARRASPDHRQ